MATIFSIHFPHNSGFIFAKLLKSESILKSFFFLEHILQTSEPSLILFEIDFSSDLIIADTFINFSRLSMKSSLSKLPKSITSKSRELSNDLKLEILKSLVLI